jgi:hypothetical protein
VFHVDESWEHTSERDVFRKFLGQPGLLRFPVVEVPINMRVLHIQILLEQQATRESYWRRFMCTSLMDALELFKAFEDSSATMSCQSQHSDGESYVIEDISEILRTTDSAGAVNHFCVVSGGRVIPDNLQGNLQTNRVTTEIVWRAIPHPNSSANREAFP